MRKLVVLLVVLTGCGQSGILPKGPVPPQIKDQNGRVFSKITDEQATKLMPNATVPVSGWALLDSDGKTVTTQWPEHFDTTTVGPDGKEGILYIKQTYEFYQAHEPAPSEDKAPTGSPPEPSHVSIPIAEYREYQELLACPRFLYQGL